MQEYATRQNNGDLIGEKARDQSHRIWVSCSKLPKKPSVVSTGGFFVFIVVLELILHARVKLVSKKRGPGDLWPGPLFVPSQLLF